jgi:hypothetical protein
VTPLRALAVALGVLAVAAGVAIGLRVPRAWPVALDLSVLGVLIVATTIWERRYRRVPAANRRAGFEATGESFVDPTSGTTVDVDYNPATGERLYRRR